MSSKSKESEEYALLQLLRDLRLKSGITQQALADRIGHPQSYVSKYEAGERRLDILELREICECLGVTLPEFVRQLERALTRAARQ